jgi:hypothetical protein
VGDTLVDVAIACIATERGVSFDSISDSGLDIQPRFMNPSMPTLAQMTDASVKIASVVPEYASTPTFWRLNGFTDEEVTTVMRELEGVTSSKARNAIFESMFGVTDDAAST